MLLKIKSIHYRLHTKLKKFYLGCYLIKNSRGQQYNGFLTNSKNTSNQKCNNIHNQIKINIHKLVSLLKLILLINKINR